MLPSGETAKRHWSFSEKQWSATVGQK